MDVTVIAIDGPAGAGKSTVARAVAHRLGFTYMDTGAMYRALALAALRDGIAPDDEEGLAALSQGADIELEGDRVILDGADVTARIRQPDVTECVSAVSAHPSVRRSMLERQRSAARAGHVVMEGRDIGSAVVPDAQVKIFLTASLEERARRRWAERGESAASIDDVTEAIIERDRSDRTREASPLVRSPDAMLIDSTDASIGEVVDRIVELASRVGAP